MAAKADSRDIEIPGEWGGRVICSSWQSKAKHLLLLEIVHGD
jgi:hypothetical protein